MIFLAYATAWISTAVAAIFGIYFTHSPWCLIAFAFPLGINLSHQYKDDESKENSAEAEND